MKIEISPELLPVMVQIMVVSAFIVCTFILCHAFEICSCNGNIACIESLNKPVLQITTERRKTNVK